MNYRAVGCTIVALALSSAVHDVLAQASKDGAASYPSRPIRLIVPVAPGGSSDGMARILGQKLTDSWNQQVLVDNRPGASEIIGTDLVAKGVPDGQTVVLVSLRFSVNPSLLKLPYDSVKDLIAAAKQKPGELVFASSGLGGAPHLVGEFFALTTGVKLTHVAYKGGGPAVADLLGGNVAMSFASMTSALQFVKAGRLRALAVSSKERSALLPDVPTMAEAGVPNIVVRDWQGVLAPHGTPKPIVDKLSAEVRRILRDPASQERFAVLGLEIIASTPQEFRASIESEIQRWAKVVKEANIKAE